MPEGFPIVVQSHGKTGKCPRENRWTKTPGWYLVPPSGGSSWGVPKWGSPDWAFFKEFEGQFATAVLEISWKVPKQETPHLGNLPWGSSRHLAVLFVTGAVILQEFRAIYEHAIANKAVLSSSRATRWSWEAAAPWAIASPRQEPRRRAVRIKAWPKQHNII